MKQTDLVSELLNSLLKLSLIVSRVITFPISDCILLNNVHMRFNILRGLASTDTVKHVVSIVKIRKEVCEETWRI